MIKGVLKTEEEVVLEILKPFRKSYDFFYYGSRVKGGFSKVSDLDILIKGKKKMPFEELQRIKTLFDASSLPYVVSLTDYYDIDESFYNLIKEDLVFCF